MKRTTRAPAPKRPGRGLLQLGALSLLLLGLDYFSKAAVVANLAPGQSIPVLGNVLRITFVQNYLVSFSFLSKAGWYRLPLAVLGVGTLMIVLIRLREPLLQRLPPLQRLLDYVVEQLPLLDPAQDTAVTQEVTLHRFIFPLAIAGIVGNLIDRFLYGYVVDFVDMGAFGFRWPVFNLADLLMMTTLILLLTGGLAQFMGDEEEDMSENARMVWLEGTLLLLCGLMALFGYLAGHNEEFLKQNLIWFQTLLITGLVIFLLYAYVAIERRNESH